MFEDFLIDSDERLTQFVRDVSKAQRFFRSGLKTIFLLKLCPSETLFFLDIRIMLILKTDFVFIENERKLKSVLSSTLCTTLLM